ncbi:MAG: hypothetical protein WKF58_07280 [Ilumatobacteraceae bacterium]
MLTNGSKLLLAGTTLAVVAAIVYGVTQDGTLGVVGLLSAAIALGLLAGIVIATRDGNVSAMDEAAAQTAVATHVASEGNVWPLIVAGGAALVVLGLVTQSAFVILGIGLLLIAGLQWMVDAGARAHLLTARSTATRGPASPVRSSSRCSPRRWGAWSSSRSAGSCCSCRRRRVRWGSSSPHC